MKQCPGQDFRFWTPDDIYDIRCPDCKNEIEFWKDDPYRPCSKCNKIIRNPRLDIGCAQWCKHAGDCLIGELIDKEESV